MLAHGSYFVGELIVPLGLYLAFRKRRPWVAAHAAEAFNFQVSVLLALGLVILTSLLSAVVLLVFIGVWGWGLGGAISRASAAGHDTLKPYAGPVLRLLRRPKLQRVREGSPVAGHG
jgi:hypothetical protein